jgi:hypothetical protein
MKIVRLILTFVLFAVMIPGMIGFFLPSEVHITRSRTIPADRQIVFQLVNNLQKWPDWSPWIPSKSSDSIIFSSPSFGSGSSFSWKSCQGTSPASIRISGSFPYDSLLLKLNFGKDNRADSRFVFKPDGAVCSVDWSYSSRFGWNPLSRWIGLFAENRIGDEMENGLSKLDRVASRLFQSGTPVVSDTILPPSLLLSVRDTVTPALFPERFDQLFSRLSGYAKRHIYKSKLICYRGLFARDAKNPQ